MRGLDLKILRVSKRIKASELARVLNISKGYLSELENDKKSITDELLQKWLAYLKS